MKYSYDWLKELSETKLSLEKLAEMLTMRSLEVEKLEETGEELESIVVGEILEIKKHPNADKLQLVKVLTSPQPSPSKGEGVLDVVCGAKNIEVGNKVPVALVGAKLPNGLEIQEAEIRGEKSFGMLCALDELGLGDDHSGIIILDSKAKIGDSAEKYLKEANSDTKTLEIKVLPDRAHDAMSHVGLAREIVVLENRKLDYDFKGLKLPNKKSKKLSVKIDDKKLCFRYIGAVMEGVEVKDSPQWMKDRLKACGINSINNIVDATNYVMLELGQPLHAFDFDKISDEIPNNKSQIPNKSQNPKSKIQIIVRRARKNEEIELLDDTKLKLSENDLLITDGGNPLALAGIMGGKNSGINENTRTIVLEAASFNSANIRRSRIRLGVRTESSDRFEKNLDPNLTEKAMVRLIEILEHTANGQVEGISDIYPNKIKSWKVKLDLDYVNNLLGEKVPRKNVLKILNLLEIKTSGRGDIITAEIPTFRVDLRTQEDLIEEVGRVWGYDKIENQPILVRQAVDDFSPETEKILTFTRNLKNFLVNIGFDEVYNYSFYSEKDLLSCKLEKSAHLELAKHFENFKIFEIGKVYSCYSELGSRSGSRNTCLPVGKEFGMTGVKENRALSMAQVLEKDRSSQTFYELKGGVENLLSKLRLLEDVTFEIFKKQESGVYNSPRLAEILIKEEKIGIIGEINQSVLNNYKISKKVVIAEFDLDKLLKVSQNKIIYNYLQKFPTITRDVSILVKNETKAAEIKKLIEKIGGKLVLNVEMFDVFFKDKQTSLAYHIEFGDSERTLENKEVDEVMAKIINGLEKDLKLEVRK